MKKVTTLLIALFLISLFAGCAGTPVVYYSDCTCPAGSHNTTADPTVATDPVVPADESVKTGLYIGTNISDSKTGTASYDVTVVAVTVDQNGVITGCIIDSLGTSVTFDENGIITSDLTVAPMTKNELGTNYGMGKISPVGKEWNEQAAAFDAFIIGKTTSEIGSMADAEGKGPADLQAAGCTIAITGFVKAASKIG